MISDIKKPTVKYCYRCSKSNYLDGNLICSDGHRPRFYKPTGTLDQDYGWKRKCADFDSASTTPTFERE